MGLFRRTEQDASTDDEDLQLPTRDDFSEPLVDEPKARTSGSKGQYSIDDAIDLMRQLPEAPDERLMEVICKTLESARISTEDVLQDAQQKEQRIRRQHQTIEQDIANLQKQIDDKQRQLAGLSSSLEELMGIKSRFEQVRKATRRESPSPEPSPGINLDESEPPEEALSSPDVATPIGAGRRGRGPAQP